MKRNYESRKDILEYKSLSRKLVTGRQRKEQGFPVFCHLKYLLILILMFGWAFLVCCLLFFLRGSDNYLKKKKKAKTGVTKLV